VVQHGAVLQLALEQHGSCRHEGCFTLLICSLLLGYLNWGRGSQGRISSASFCRGRSFAVQNGSEHFNAAAAGQASCRGVLVRGCSLLPPRRLIPGHDRGHVVRARTQLAQMALRSLTDMHVRLCVSRQDELSREPPRSAAAAAALLTACSCYERLLLGVAQTCRTCFAKAAGAAQQGQYEYVILQVSFSLRVGTGSRCVSCAGSWCDGQCRCAPRWAAPLWGHALRGHARQCQWTRVDSLARCLVCVVCVVCIVWLGHRTLLCAPLGR
jgi:hypothetical protein